MARGAVVVGSQQGLDHVVGGAEVAAVSGFDGADRQRDGEVGLAAAGLSEEQDRPVFVDESQAGEVLDEFAVH